MRWTPGRRSRNLEDRRAAAGGRTRMRGAGMRLPIPTGKGGMSLTGLVVVMGIVWLMGGNPLSLLTGDLGGMGGQTQASVDGGVGSAPVRATPEEERLVDFVSFVLDDTQTVWRRLQPGYRDAQLVLFRGGVRSACGNASAAMGPFYCPGDQKVYIDLGFYGDLARRFGAPGDFAQAYVLAHEIGHHLQHITGIEPKVRQLQRQRPGQANALSVRMELQADCFAGVWAHSTAKRDLLDPGDLEEGLSAAAAVGDDRIQEMSGTGVQPESFTHGSSRQRVEWFRRGFDSGDPEQCDTFAGL